MGGFEGWWVNGRTGKGHHVSEHWMEVRSNPEKYGLSEEQVARILKAAGGKFNPGDTSPDGARGMLLKAAMDNGWVRVRGYQGKYAIQTNGSTASLLPKVLKFMKGAGVGPYSEILLSDLASTYNQRFMEGMSDIAKALKQGKIPDIAPKAGDDEGDRIKNNRKPISKPDGIPTGLNDKQARVLMRQRLGQRHHIPDPDPGDDKIEERQALAKGLAKLLG